MKFYCWQLGLLSLGALLFIICQLLTVEGKKNADGAEWELSCAHLRQV